MLTCSISRMPIIQCNKDSFRHVTMKTQWELLGEFSMFESLLTAEIMKKIYNVSLSRKRAEISTEVSRHCGQP